MGWIEGLNASVDYIEGHLDGDADWKDNPQAYTIRKGIVTTTACCV